MCAERPFDVFLSYNSADRGAVEAAACLLRDRGRSVFLDRWYLSAGTPWPEELERHLSSCRTAAIFVGPHGLGRWQYREYYVAIDRQVREPAFRVVPVLLPGADPPLGFLSLYTWADLRSGIDEASIQPLVAATSGEATPADERSARAARDLVCPYRGLKVFREEDAAFFCGREEFVGKLAKACADRAFVGVVGASGSGKSSVVRAGLVPRLRRRPDGVTWDIATMVPGDRPFYALAGVLVPLLEPELSEIARLRETGQLAEDLQAGRVQMRDALARALQRQPGTDRLLLIVDQFEELYTLTKDGGTRRRFVDGLVQATSTGGSLSIVATLRGDFFDEILNDRPLADRLDGGVVTVSRMSAAELRRVIEEPAARAGLRFDPGLPSRMLDATETQSESLPLLEFVLRELWNHREPDGLLTHAAYETIGELRGAIAVHAQSTFDRLTTGDQELARRVFLQVVRPGERSPADYTDAPEPTRRRTTFKEVGADKTAIVRRLADAHLLVTGRDDSSGEEFIDLVHEALIKAWAPLRSWIADEDDFLRWRERLRALMAASQSQAGRKAPAALLRGALLDEAVRMRRTRDSDLSTSEQRYIDDSRLAVRNERGRTTAAAAAFVVAVPLIAWGVWTLTRPDTTAAPADVELGERRPPNNLPAPDEIDVRGVVVPTAPVRIPTVFHLLYGQEDDNVGDGAIQAALARVNEDLSATSDDLRLVPEPFRARIGDARLSLHLATTEPGGRPSTGIERTRAARKGPFPLDDTVKYQHRGGADAWPAGRYLNVWVVPLESGLLEYSQFPGAQPETDGIVLSPEVFRMPNGHRSLTHGVGHWLGLRHTWGDVTDCSGTDYVDDTPNQAGPSFEARRFPHITCNNGPHGDLFMNFMDFSDGAVMFTKGQVVRMHAALRKYRSGFAATR